MKKSFLLLLLLCGVSNFTQSAQVRGWPDTSFNAQNLFINNNGTATQSNIPAQGALLIDLGGEDTASVVLLNSTGSYILVGTSQREPFNSEFGAIAVITQQGTLDRTFNPQQGSINNSGVFFTGGSGAMYSGALLFNFSDRPTPDTRVQVATLDDTDNIYVAGATRVGPGIFENAFLAAFTPTGSLLKSFNPSGINYDASGNPTGGGFPGLVALSIGERVQEVRGLVRDTDGNFYLGARGATGPDLTGLRNSNFLVFSITPTGLLNTQFNQDNVAINTAGAEVTGVYEGILAIAVGVDNIAQRGLAIDDNDDLVLLGYGQLLSTGTLEAILAKVSTSGILDRTFNPSGLAISSTGLEEPGGYSGIKIVQVSPSGITLGKTIGIGPDNTILVGALGFRQLSEQFPETAFVYLVLNEDGSANQAFNPSGLNINVAGQLVNDGLGYPGVLYDETGFIVTPRGLIYDGMHNTYNLVGAGFGKSPTASAGGAIFSSVSTTGLNDNTVNPNAFAAQRPFLVSGREGLTVLSAGAPMGVLNDLLIDIQGRYVLGGAAIIDSETNPSFAILRLNAETIIPTSPTIDVQTSRRCSFRRCLK